MCEHTYHLRGYDIFEMVRDGIKLYELRVYDDKRRHLKIGDWINFISLETEEVCVKEVEGIYVFDNFDELFKSIPIADTGLASPNDVFKFFSRKDISEFGVVAIKLKPCAA